MGRSADSDRARLIATRVIVIGAFLIAAPILMGPSILAQPQCIQVTHPFIHATVEKVLELFDRAGEACVIGGLLGILIDEGLKTKFIKDVVSAASPELLGLHLPTPIRVVLLNYFNISFVRPDWDIEYEITPIMGKPNYVKLTSRIQGALENRASEAKTFDMVSSIDPTPREPGESQIVRISMQPELGSGGFDERPDNSKLEMPDGSKLFRRSLLIGAGERWRTVLETVEYYPVSAVLPLFAGTTVIRATVRIRYPKDLLELHVGTGERADFKPEPTQWGAEWEIPTVILPGQCIVATWNPKAKVSATVPSLEEIPTDDSAMTELAAQPAAAIVS